MNHIQWVPLRPERSSLSTAAYTGCCASTNRCRSKRSSIVDRVCRSASRHGRQDLHDLRHAQIGVLLEETRVFAVHEDRDEAAERAVAQDARAEIRIARSDLALQGRKVSGVELDRALSADGGAQGCGETNGDAHASTSSYARRNASASASMTG